MSLNRLRYHQQARQIQVALQPGAGTIANYDTRDPITGQRSIHTADGGSQIAQYISNSTPTGVIPLAQSSTIGLPGYISQKPA